MSLAQIDAYRTFGGGSPPGENGHVRNRKAENTQIQHVAVNFRQ